MNLSQQTLDFYHYTAGKFVEWLSDEAGLVDPAGVRSHHIRAYMVSLRERGLSDGSVLAHTRAIRALVSFWQSNDWIPESIKVRIDLPKVDRKRLPTISAEDAKKLIAVCKTQREKALVFLLIDSGLRRAEACALNWGDMDLKSGVVRIQRGKGGKARSVIIGATTRRAILRYRRIIPHDFTDPVFQSERGGGRLTGSGMRGILKRLGKRACIEVTVHAFRRGFAALSLRAGMSPLHLQGLLGHSSLEMVRRYVQLVDDDLKRAHEEHGPVDRWLS